MRHVIGFKDQFAPLVESGAKTQTIRTVRKRPIRVGDELRLYVRMRRPECRLLGVATCEAVEGVAINGAGTLFWSGCARDAVEARDFAIADGFQSYDEMRAWFEMTRGLPFAGVVIRWGALREKPQG